MNGHRFIESEYFVPFFLEITEFDLCNFFTAYKLFDAHLKHTECEMYCNDTCKLRNLNK